MPSCPLRLVLLESVDDSLNAIATSLESIHLGPIGEANDWKYDYTLAL